MPGLAGTAVWLRLWCVRALLAGCTLLAGCALTPLQPLPQRPSAVDIVQFSCSGRLSIRQAQTRHHVRIDWRHDAQGDTILLTTPLGQGVAEITRNRDGARLVLADQREFVAADGSALAEQVLGFPLPLEQMSRWLLGNIGDVATVDASATWRVRVLAHESAAPGALPATIEIERDDIHVLLKIDEWSEVQ